ncbi:MAG: signal recognition particle-docking protein FtsY, partial [Candidatus Binatia bacterium]
VLLILLLVARHLRERAAQKRLEAERAEAPPPPVAPPREEVAPEALPGRLRAALAKSRDALRARLDAVLGQPELDGMLPGLEEAMVAADVGVTTTSRILESLRRRVGVAASRSPANLRAELCASIEEILGDAGEPPRTTKPWVILVAGVNGVGKTTTIGKLAARLRAAGDRVLLVAADTFRAAAIDQLGVWAERVGADVVRHRSGADPGAVAFDGIQAAVARGADVVLVDTAGRLHTRENLMEELRKVSRVIGKALPGAPHEVLLVLDATTGQNALRQAKVFSETLGVTGIVLTKLDGTAKGGAALAVRQELGVPIRYVGVGERVEDLRRFSAREFAAALVGEEQP